MSYRRIFSLRELALCLVILANAIGLGAVILTTAMATSPALASVDAESSEDTAAGVIERVDQGRIGADASDADSDTTIPAIEVLPGLPSGKEPVSLSTGDASATKSTFNTEKSSGSLSLVDTTNDPLTQIPAGGNMVPAHDAGMAAEEDNLSDPTPLNTSTPESSPLLATESLDLIVEPRTLEIAKAMLKADYEELMDSGLDFSSAIKELDLMAEEERYGEFGKR